jgi:TonB-linked SusC/RagA family outer membrane protein
MYKLFAGKVYSPPGYIKKLMLVMRLIIILLTAAFLQVSAGGFAQKVSITEKNASLERVLIKIKKQTGYDFLYDEALLEKAKPVSIKLEKVDLIKALEICFNGQDFTYAIDGKTIILKEKTTPFLDRLVNRWIAIDVSGRIVDAEGKGIPGATVRVKGTSRSVITGATGSFYLANVDEAAILVISYVGFQTREIKAGRDVGSISMQIADAKLDEVNINVNTGYQSISKERATGAYSFINGKQLESKLKPDLRAAMEGLAAGMVLTKEGNIEIRGVSTFLTGTDRIPLIVVDGFPISGGLETINIDNVESITVLKDGVAASIYGTRSSNGVIVVTTRQGKKGKLSVDYKVSTGMTLKPDLSYLNRANSSDYVDAEIDLYNANPTLWNTQYNNRNYISRVTYLMAAKTLGVLSAADVDKEIAQLKQNDGLGQLEDYVFREQLTQQHNLAISGGSEKSILSASVKYITNRGNMLYTKDNRMIADLKNDWKVSDKVLVKLFSNINYNTSDAPAVTSSDLLGYYINSAGVAPLHPYDLVVDPSTGQPQEVFNANPLRIARYAALPGLKPLNYNPLTDIGLENTRTENLQIRMGGSVNVSLMKGLTAEAGGVWTRGNQFQRTLYDKNAYRVRFWYDNASSVSNTAKHYIPDGSIVDESRSVNQSYTLRGQVNFNRTFNKHSIIAIVGTELSKDVLDNNIYPTRFGYNDLAGTFATFNYADFNAGLYNADMLSTARPPSPVVNIGQFQFRDNRFFSWYGNTSYEYDQRFIISGSIRLDQTNFFGTNPDYRYKPLWSVGGVYKVSHEKYFNVPWISKLNLRGSYGINGNISLNSGPFLIIAPGAFSTSTGDISYSITSPPNNSLRWEKTSTMNIGSDISFLKSRINLSLDYYLRKSKDLIAPDMIDPTLGYASLSKNVGQINNSGLEVTLEGDVIRNGDFVWNALGTLSHNKNKVVKYYNANYIYTSIITSGSISREGYSSNAIFSYRSAGLDANGNTLYYNNAGQKVGGGQITVADLQYSGTLRPEYVYGLTNTFKYKSFGLAFMLIAKTGNVLRKDTFTGGNYQNKNVAQRWKNPGDENTTIYPKLSSNSSDPSYFPFADIFVEDASYIKLRDVSLTYDVNKRLLKSIGLANAKIYFQGRNLFLWTANSDKRDPEISELNAGGSGGPVEQGYTSLPLRPEFYIGLSLNF